MTLLSRKADYALLILAYLHGHPAGGTAKAIADQYGLSRAFVANILKELGRGGYVASHRGVKGGYALLRSPATVTLAELLESIEEGFRLTVCSHGGHDPCSLTGTCPVQRPLADIHRRISDVLRSVTLADVFAHRPPAASALPLLPPPALLTHTTA